jgi:hypothetical protein
LFFAFLAVFRAYSVDESQKVKKAKNSILCEILMRIRITLGPGVANQKPGLQSILKAHFFRFFFTSHKISIGDRFACRFSALERKILAKQRPKCNVRQRPSTGGGQPSEKFRHFGQIWTQTGLSQKKHSQADKF